jgi:hypothetical protein
MDVDSLKAELEKHLANNPDEHAPHGFRDRFNTLLEQYQSEDGAVPKPILEQELQQIRNEAEAAAKAAGTEPADDLQPAPDAAPAPRADAVATPPAPAEQPAAPDYATPSDASVDQPSSGFGAGAIALIVIIVVALAAAYYFFRR